ncbi:MAG: PIN domain-containing protein [Chloroflexota bacterium]|nr:PIN domain-containing protein [Chloroflexota bacterium]
MVLILDTSAVLAAIDAADPDHGRCADLITGVREDLIVPALVLGELDYWCAHRLSVDDWLTFVAEVGAGVYQIEPPTVEDLERCADLQDQYRDLSLGVVDASVVALAERLNEPKIATLDQRHFRVVRPRHVPAFELWPT